MWHGRGVCSCTYIRSNEPSEHFFRLCEHQKVFMKTSWARKFVFASQSQEGVSRRIFYLLFWGSEGDLFHCSCGSFLFWAMVWRDAHPIELELGAFLVLPTMYFIVCAISFPKCHVDFKDFLVCISSPSFVIKNHDMSEVTWKPFMPSSSPNSQSDSCQFHSCILYRITDWRETPLSI